jgi:hypothetical protein
MPKPPHGRRHVVAALVAIAPIPDALRNEAGAVCGCIGGAAAIDEVKAMLMKAGFKSVEITIAPNSPQIVA